MNIDEQSILNLLIDLWYVEAAVKSIKSLGNTFKEPKGSDLPPKKTIDLCATQLAMHSYNYLCHTDKDRK